MTVEVRRSKFVTTAWPVASPEEVAPLAPLPRRDPDCSHPFSDRLQGQ